MSNLAHRIELTAKDQKIKSLEDKIADRDKVIAELEKALSFYANRDNWNSMTDGRWQFVAINKCDEGYLPLNRDNFSIKTAGKIANQALANLAEFRKGIK